MKADAVTKTFIQVYTHLIAETFTCVLSNLAFFAPLSFASASPLDRLRLPRPKRAHIDKTPSYTYIASRGISGGSVILYCVFTL